MKKILLKEGFREGKSSSDDKIFQNSFDNGYEDGFKMGFLLGKLKKQKAGLGNCDLCKDVSLFKKTETDVREVFRKKYQDAIIET